MIDRFLSQAANLISESTNRPHAFRIDKDGLSLLCEFDYPGNVRSLRNLVFELTSYVGDREWISVELVQSTLARLRSRLAGFGPSTSDLPQTLDAVAESYNDSDQILQLVKYDSFLQSVAREDDVILPLELCILRREETFKQWSARAKRCSIEAVHEATGGSMRSAAARLGLTQNSLLGHLHQPGKFRLKVCSIGKRNLNAVQSANSKALQEDRRFVFRITMVVTTAEGSIKHTVRNVG